jgi:hypothetical protein
VGCLIARCAAVDVDDSAVALPAAYARDIAVEEKNNGQQRRAEAHSNAGGDWSAIKTTFIKFQYAGPGDDALPEHGRDLTSTLSWCSCMFMFMTMAPVVDTVMLLSHAKDTTVNSRAH